jgi:hypothetical protein
VDLWRERIGWAALGGAMVAIGAALVTWCSS